MLLSEYLTNLIDTENIVTVITESDNCLGNCINAEAPSHVTKQFSRWASEGSLTVSTLSSPKAPCRRGSVTKPLLSSPQMKQLYCDISPELPFRRGSVTKPLSLSPQIKQFYSDIDFEDEDGSTCAANSEPEQTSSLKRERSSSVAQAAQ
mmetsp:Transcript_5224/g.6827  ORF Transcript_5224/g.6827 Transcript_5224/m.6827 type:complete len:150 (-) Transcript_5224:366-815(-)